MTDVDVLLAPVRGGMQRVLCCHKAKLSGRFAPNSLAAVEECISASAPRIEFDLWVLADGTQLILHDRTLDRETTATGGVAALRREDLAGLAFRDGTPLAFLEDIVAAAEGSGTMLQVDLKGFAPIPREHLAGLARTLEPVQGHVIVGSQAHWNTRCLATMGVDVAFDTTLQWHVREDNSRTGITPAQLGLHGLWDDAMLAHEAGIPPPDYIASRIEDLLALLPAVEWMVDWRTLFHLQDLGCDLGWLLREKSVSLAAWTLKDEGPIASVAKMDRLFDLGVETIITEDALALAGYLAGGEGVPGHQSVTRLE